MRAIAARCLDPGLTVWDIDRSRSSGGTALLAACRCRGRHAGDEDAAMVRTLLDDDGHAAPVARRRRPMKRERSDGLGAGRWRREPTGRQ